MGALSQSTSGHLVVLMSMIIISAICQGFPKHLIWTQHQAGRWKNTVCCWQTVFIDTLFIHYLLLYLSVLAHFHRPILAIPSTPPTCTLLVSSLAPNPHPYPVHLIMSSQSRGKCHYGNRGRGSGGLSMGERGIERKREKKDWELADAEESTSGHLAQILF